MEMIHHYVGRTQVRRNHTQLDKFSMHKIYFSLRIQYYSDVIASMLDAFNFDVFTRMREVWNEMKKNVNAGRIWNRAMILKLIDVCVYEVVSGRWFACKILEHTHTFLMTTILHFDNFELTVNVGGIGAVSKAWRRYGDIRIFKGRNERNRNSISHLILALHSAYAHTHTHKTLLVIDVSMVDATNTYHVQCQSTGEWQIRQMKCDVIYILHAHTAAAAAQAQVTGASMLYLKR